MSAAVRKYSPVDLEARMLYPEDSRSTVTVTSASGEQIKGDAGAHRRFRVALRDASGWDRSFSRDRVKVELQDPLAAHQQLLGS